MSKVEPHLRSACAVEVNSGLMELMFMKQVMMISESDIKTYFTLGSNCQSTMHKFDSKQFYSLKSTMQGT